MENSKSIVNFIQATYDLESLLVKVESLCMKVNQLHSQIDFDSLTQEELAIIQGRALKVLQVADRMQEVNK